MSVLARMVLLALLVGLLIGFGLFVGGEGGVASSDGFEGASPRFHSSAQCAECHRDVWNEWYGSHHQIAYRNPEVRALSDDFRNKECQACHLPRPVAVTGYAKRTLHRTTLPDEGVSCLTCHLGKSGEILGRNTVLDAPCQPIASPAMTSVSMCESCHNQHGTTDQWRATPFAENGTDCNACHMPQLERPRGTLGRSHVFAGSHDVGVLRSAVRFDARVEEGRLVVEVENVGAGHHFPTEERSRAADVEVRFGDSGEWQRMHRFRLPYRNEPLPDTTLAFGAVEHAHSDIPERAASAVVRLSYRLTPFVGDGDPRSAVLFERFVDLQGAAPVVGELRLPPLPEVSAFRPTIDPEEIVVPEDVTESADAGVAASLPALVLEPRLARLRAVVDAAPPAPDEERMSTLRELVRAALVPGAATARFARLARRGLPDEPGAFLALEELLVHERADVRSLAAYELGRLAEPASVVPLVLRLKYEVDAPETMIWVAHALTRFGNFAGLPEIVRWMRVVDTAELAGQRAIEICRDAGEDPGEAPSWDDLAERLQRLHATWLADGTMPAPDALTVARIARHLIELEAFQLRGVDEARFTLSRLGGQAVPLLREALRASEPYLRTHALEIVRNLGAPAVAAAPEVVPLLGDELTKADAARALGRLGAPIAIPHLVSCLRAVDLELRAAAAGSLGPLGATSAIPELRAVFDDVSQSIDVRVQAAFSLALLKKDTSACEWLEGLQSREEYHAPTLQELIDTIRARR